MHLVPDGELEDPAASPMKAAWTMARGNAAMYQSIDPYHSLDAPRLLAWPAPASA